MKSAIRSFRLWIVSSLVLAGGLVVVSLSSCSSHSDGVVDAGSGEAKTVQNVTVEGSDQVVDLNAENTEVKWSCANAVGLVQVGYFFDLDGEAVLDELGNPKQLKMTFNMNEMKANALSLSKKLQGPGFFETDKYPTATFTSTSIVKNESAEGSDGSTHQIEANLQIRDITKSIKIPVKVESDSGKLLLKSEFKLNRKDFGVVHPVAIEDRAIDDDVVINVAIDAKSKAEQNAEATSKRVQKVDLGPRFTEVIPATLVEFEMIRVPGDANKGIKDFYIGKCEVTWEEFDYWALCKDQSEKNAVMLRNRLLRPSAPHNLEATYRGWGREGQPALGVSQKAAKLFCEWLSEQTGKRYRLPTLAEWRHAHELGGGDDYVADKTKIAWFADNTLDDEGFDNRAMKVGQLQPNKLGIHDMLGNVSEWVADEPLVIGGNFLSAAEDLTADNVEHEDQNVWNATYPQIPKSIWWYKDADYVGFRVVCDAE